jgi:hypothetical protein
MVEKPLEATNTSSEGETSTPEYQVILIVIFNLPTDFILWEKWMFNVCLSYMYSILNVLTSDYTLSIFKMVSLNFNLILIEFK